MTADRATFDVLSSEPKFEGRVLSVRVDRVRMPGGGSALREVVGHDRAVAVVVVDIARGDEEDPDLVLIEQYRHPLRRRLWELPAGLMDLDTESPLVAVQRELAEETGLAALDWSVLVDIAPSPGFCEETIRIFLARGITEIDRPHGADDEEAELRVVRVPLSEAVRAVYDGRILNATAVAGVLATTHVVEHKVHLRPAEDSWDSFRDLVHRGPDVPDAPALPASAT